MKSRLKRFITIMLTMLFLVSGIAGCSNSAADVSDATDTADKPDTWIADRTITIQAYVDDIGYSLPDNLEDTAVMQEITKRTGIKLDIQYTPGDSDSSVMASQLASGTIPDVIVSYLNNSTKKEFPILLKAAKEGMFADVSSYLADTEVYSRYSEDGYLPNDSYKNIVYREDMDGAVYMLPLSIDAEDTSTVFDPTSSYVGGLYIQKSIVEALGIDPTEIRTQDQFYDLLVQIKNGGFKDDNGNDVYPLGPKFYGGSTSSLEYIVNGFTWGVSNGYNITDDGTIMHEVDTDYVYEKINYIRKLLAEGLMNPEFFTMDETRAEEVSTTHNSAIIADVNNYQDIIYQTGDWVPLGPLDDFTGDNSRITHGKTQYGAWAISADAENPEEIVEFFDYLSTVEGQLLCEYGVEGVSYNMVDGMPVLTDDVLDKLSSGDYDSLINTVGASFGNQACVFFGYVLTNLANEENFGEARPGSNSSDTFEKSIEIATEYPRTYKLVPGLDATAYLSDESLSEVNAQMSLLNYNDMLVQAIYANSDEEVQEIVETFSKQLKEAGEDELIDYLEALYAEDKDAIDFYTK